MIRWRPLLNLLPAAFSFAASQRLVLERDYRGALEQLQSLSRRLGSDFPSVELPLRANLLGLQSAYFLQNGELCEKCALVVVIKTKAALAQRDRPQTRYTAEYVSRFLEHCAGRFEPRAEVFLGLASEVNALCQPYKLSAVPKFLRREMPMQESDFREQAVGPLSPP